MDSFVAGVVAGYGIAIPVGAIAAYLVALTARTSLRVGWSAALGVASADGLYALLAVLGGAVLAGAVSAVAGLLQWVSFAVLLLLATRTGVVAVREFVHPHVAGNGRAPVTRPLQAYVVLLGATLLNPTTIVYFAALVLGGQDGTVVTAADRVGFVAGAFLASASWQLLLAGSGAALGRVLTGPRGRFATGLVSAALIGALAFWTLLG